MIIFLTFLNTLGVQLGKIDSEYFYQREDAFAAGIDFSSACLWGATPRPSATIFRISGRFAGRWRSSPERIFCAGWVPTITAASGAFGLFVAFGVAQVGSLFSADAWNNIGFTAAEVKNPKRDVALSMAFGTMIVITLYVLANVAYLCALPLAQIQHAPDDRVASAALNAVFGPVGASIMAVAIIISTFGCNNGLILAGARVAYAMAKDGLFFRATGTLNKRRVPSVALVYQCVWIIVLILLRTRRVDAAGAVTYGNLYSDLLNYVVFSVLLFYVLTIAGIFVLRTKRPDAERPYRAFGYPVVPLLYIVAAVGDHGGAAAVSNANDLAGVVDRAAGRAGIPGVVAARAFRNARNERLQAWKR